MQHEVPATRIEEIFSCLPLPYNDEEFKTDINCPTENKLEPPPYEQIKRNFYLINRKCSKVDADTGCASCSSTECSEACTCRVQYISCSKGCRCKGKCQNRPFHTEKKIQIVKVDGEIRVGVFAATSIQVGEPLTYDYRFEQFGPEVECICGVENCQGNLGIKKKAVSGRRNKRKIDLNFSWGAKRQRSYHLIY